MLGALLKKGNTPFEIYERAREVEPLGMSRMVLWDKHPDVAFSNLKILPIEKDLQWPSAAT